MDKVEAAVEAAMEGISDVGDDTVKFTQEESADFYEGVATDCSMRAVTIRHEMEAG